MSYFKKFVQFSPSEWPSVWWYSLLTVLRNRIPARTARNYETIRKMLKMGIQFERKGPFNMVSSFPSYPFRILIKRKSSDLQVVHQLFIENEYQPLFDLLKKHNLNCRTIIDAGANIGCSSLLFHHHFPEAHVLALEPNLQVSNRCIANMKLNKLATEVWQKGLWQREGHLAEDRSFRDGEDWSYRLREAKPNEKGSIEVVDVPYIMKTKNWTKVDLLKMDIEGGECDVFQSDEEVDQWLPKVNCLAIEIHDEFNCRSTIEQALKRNGFEPTETKEGLTLAIRKNMASI